ncbi:MAG: protein kinase [Myxococcales bacterium]|nr:protein kinase [Myxococcales bacterium]
MVRYGIMGTIEFNGTERYELREHLGSGAFGDVYEAWDNYRQMSVALKALKVDNAFTILRFKNEFRALADINHPNLVGLYELAQEGGVWFFTMELIEGLDFLSYVWDEPHAVDGTTPSAFPTVPAATSLPVRRKLPSGETVRPKANAEKLRHTTSQVAEALIALHGAGKLHRDIKPSNIQVTREGRAVLLDFGLVTDKDPTRSDQTIDLAGTPEYMSPEQAAGLTLTEASDWYSLGVILYQALTGQLPFDGRPFDILVQKQRRQPTPPELVIPDLDPTLCQLCKLLLERIPDRRPRGMEVLQHLGYLASTTVSTASLQTRGGAPLVGRTAQMAALRDALRVIGDGGNGIVLLHGPSGSGKTFLTQTFLASVEQERANALLLSGRCYEQESVPYKAFDSMIDQLTQMLVALPGSELKELIPPNAGLLARLFPVLRQIGVIANQIANAAEVPDAAELRRRAFSCLRELFVRLRSRSIVILSIDDLQWSDWDSAALLLELVRPPDAPSLMVILTYDEEEAESSHVIQALHHGRFTEVEIPVWEVEMPPLRESEAEELARLCLQSVSVDPDAAARVIATASEGNPFLVRWLATYWAELEHQEIDGDDDTEQAPPTLTLEQVLQDRFQRLSRSAQRMLAALVVFGLPLEIPLAQRAADIDEHDHAALAELRASYLVRTRMTGGHGTVEVLQEPLRRALYGQLSQEERRQVHRRLAETLEASGQADTELLSMHFRAAGDGHKAAKYRLEAAQRAIDAFAFDRAARLLRDAYEMKLEAGDDDAQLKVRLGDTLSDAGRGAEAAEWYERAAPHLGAHDGTVLRQKATDQLLRSGRIDKGLETLETLIGDIGMSVPTNRARVLGSLLWQRVLFRFRGYRFEQRAIHQIAPETLTHVDICRCAVMGLGLVDTMKAALFQSKHLSLALEAGEPVRAARALLLEAAFSAAEHVSRRPKALQIHDQASTIADETGRRELVGMAKLSLGIIEYQAGNWKRTIDLCREAETIFRDHCTGVAWELYTAQHHRFAAYYYSGLAREINRAVPPLLTEYAERGDLYAMTSLRTWLSHLRFLAADRPQEVERQATAAMERWSQRGFHLQHWQATLACAEAALYEADGVRALELFAKVRPKMRAAMLHRVQLIDCEFLFGCGRSLLVCSDAAPAAARANALARAARCGNKLVQHGLDWSKPLGHSLLAGVAFRRDALEDGATHLAAAIDGFARSKMVMHRAALIVLHTEIAPDDFARSDSLGYFRTQGFADPLRMARTLAPYHPKAT